MPAVRWLPQHDRLAHLVRRGQAIGRHERVVARIEHERRDADAVQVRLGRLQRGHSRRESLSASDTWELLPQQKPRAAAMPSKPGFVS